MKHQGEFLWMKTMMVKNAVGGASYKNLRVGAIKFNYSATKIYIRLVHDETQIPFYIHIFDASNGAFINSFV